MSYNSFGHLFRVTTWGESHGPQIGCVIDGCPPNVSLSLSQIQHYLDLRKPGQSKYTTQRKESDRAQLLSGVVASEDEDIFITTGTPISIMIENSDQRSKDYGDIAKKYRPGHADYVYDKKYGLRDYRGGGRSSARETAVRVAAGAVARQILPDIKIRGAVVAIGPIDIVRDNWDWAEVANNPFFCPDAQAAVKFGQYLDEIRKQGSSAGAVIEIVAENVPAGLGAPLYGKLDQDIASLLMSINAVKGVEIGAGFASARLRGEQNGDEMRMNDEGEVEFLSNNAGGILGGISTGQPILARFAVKPTSSITIPMASIDADNHEVEVITKGRHDPCVGIRAVGIGEAMVACALVDHYLRHRGQTGRI